MEVRPGYKQSEVGVIPEDWEVKPLVDLAKVRSGIAKNSNKAVSNPLLVHYLRVANVQDGYLDLSEMSMIEVGRDAITRYAVLPGDVLMNEGGDLDKLGRGAIWRGEFSPCIHQNHVFVVRCGETLSPDYLNAWTGATPARQYFLVAGKQTTNLASINKTALGQLPVTLPPTKAEQEAIAEALSDADGLIESLEQLITKKRHLKQGAMQELLTGKKRLPGFSGAWEVKRLGELAVLSKTGVNPAANPATIYTHFSLPAFDAGATPVVEEGGGIGSNKFIVPNNAVLLSKLNPRIPRIWAPENIPENSVCSTEFLVLIPREVTNRNYLATLCLSPQVCYQMELHAIGTTGSHQRINPSQAMAIEIDFPTDKTEQTAIAAILSDLDTELAALETKLTKARRIKQGMMQELLTGRIRLVQPAARIIPLPTQKQSSPAVAKSHNWQINEAVIIGVLAKHFGSEKFPLARKRCTKLTYLLHRHVERQAEGYLKKAAGPYNPAVKYKGPEGIAQKNGYVRPHHNGTYPGFVAAANIAEAEAYFTQWYGPEVLPWLEQFRFKKTDYLELLTTVDMAMEDLRREGRAVNLDAVKQVIRDHPEWEAKLEREIFADPNIVRAIAECRELFHNSPD